MVTMKAFCFVALLCFRKLASGAITLNFNVNGVDTPTRVFNFPNVSQTLVTDVGARNPVFTVAPESAPFAGATGSLKITWTGKSLTEGGENATFWSFGPNATILSTIEGLGVQSPGETGSSNQMGNGEAIVLSFDVSSLGMSPGSFLVFSILSDVGDTFQIFSRTSVNSGALAFSLTRNTSFAVPSAPLQVNSGYASPANTFDFAIADAGWNGGGLLRIKSFSVDVVSQTAAPVPVPTRAPSRAPTRIPSRAPSGTPSRAPSRAPSKAPSSAPSKEPSSAPSKAPSPVQAPVPIPSTADTQIIVDFHKIGSENTSKLFRYTNVGAVSPSVADVGTTAVCFTVNPSSQNLAGASGSLAVTWTGKDRGGNTQNVSAWTFGTDAIVHSTLDGLGVKSAGDTGTFLQLQAGEAFVLAFNTSTLSLYPGSQLVFTVRSGANETYRIYQRTGLNSAVNVFSRPSLPVSTPTDAILVTSGYQTSPSVYEFAIADAGWNGGGALRMTQFSVGIVGAPPSTTYVSPGFYPIFTDNMVLQRDANVKIYGTATPGMTVTLTFGSLSKSAAVDTSGKWSVTLEPMPASYSPQTLTVSDGLRTATATNVLVGDVWLCSGQSNMDRGFQQFASLSTTGLDNPFIRLVQVTRGGPRTPAESLTLTSALGGSWQEATSVYLKAFSPGAYFFGARMEANNSVPMGLMHVAKGSTMIETWSSAEALISLGIDPNFNDTYTRNYNGMIYPLRDFTFKGVLWYQGESNTDNPLPYGQQLSTLITSWRALFGRGDIPFYYAQLAAHGSKDWDLSDSAKPFIRESQVQALAVNNTRMIVLMDAGEYLSIHPENKMAVGERFARHALIAEGHSGINVDSPTFQNLQIVGNQAIVTFTKVGVGLETRELKMNYNEGLAQGTDPQAFVATANKLVGFQLAGPNQVFVDANASITASNQVTVSSPYISSPIAVRYCFKWFDMCNLYASNDGLVAIPFRSDNFSLPNYEGNTTGTVFNGNYSSLGDAMIPSTSGPSNISAVTLFGVKGYKVQGTGLKVMYFSTNNTAFQNGPRPYVIVTVLYYDQGLGIVNFSYDTGVNTSSVAPLSILLQNSKTWRVANVVLRDALFGKQLSGFDLQLQSKVTMYIGGVYLTGP